MSKILKILGAIIAIVVTAGIIIYATVRKDLPSSVHRGEPAILLLEQMKSELDAKAWDNTRWVQWTFMDVHHYIWDRARHLVRVRWDIHEVLLDPNTVQGEAYTDDVRQVDEAAQTLVTQAYEKFINDAFWLAAPFMIDQEGVDYAVAESEDGREGLMVHYSSGGVTPGDKYLFLLDRKGRPTAYQMWVKIIPVGGMECSWEDWTQLSSGAWISQLHDCGAFSIKISSLRDADNYMGLDLAEDPFLPLKKKLH